VPALNAAAEISEIVGVVCQPDRPAGRGMKLRAPAVKVRAAELGIEAYQPTKVRDGSLAAWMRELTADVALVIAYGRILDAETLAAPRLGCVNLHASLLPEFRGAAPIQRVIMSGKTETGVCLMKMDEGMDTGDLLACHRLSILPSDTTGTLSHKIGELAATVTREELARYVQGQLCAQEQNHKKATHAPPITREDTPLDFRRGGTDLMNQIRGLAPRPGATAQIERTDTPTRRLKILQVELAPSNANAPHRLSPGEVSVADGILLVGTGSAPLRILSAQLEGKKVQPAADILNGRGLLGGDVLK